MTGPVASYRQTVLTAFQQVEDNIATLRILEEEARVQGEAVESARKSVQFALNQYNQGTVNYLSVITAQDRGAHQRKDVRHDSEQPHDGERASYPGLGRRMEDLVPAHGRSGIREETFPCGRGIPDRKPLTDQGRGFKKMMQVR